MQTPEEFLEELGRDLHLDFTMSRGAEVLARLKAYIDANRTEAVEADRQAFEDAQAEADAKAAAEKAALLAAEQPSGTQGTGDNLGHGSDAVPSPNEGDAHESA